VDWYSFYSELSVNWRTHDSQERPFRDEIIFWSGGAEYAKECATKLHLWDMAYAFAHKNKSNFHMVQEGDIVIDDDSFSDLPKEEQIRTHTPFNWPEEEWKGRPDKEIIKHVT